ncbi:MaoC family dehydratase [Amaricoccus tamworthensis]|uniref:MaoC family dehydratase n=1 Tax=Amaricoccus tamworthensis TaxID=57002 RepID=UPI003C7A6753
MTKSKTFAGYFFEDYYVGQVIAHAVPRTVTEGDRAVYQSLYPSRFAVASSDEFARACGFEKSPVDDLIAFHVVFGKTVPDISLNAVANLGYADGRFLRRVYPGDTLTSSSEVIGLKQNSNGKSGVVYVRTTGRNQHGEEVLTYCRWVMVRKRDVDAPATDTVVPDLPDVVSADKLVVPDGLSFAGYDHALAGEKHGWGDYAPGERIDHVDAVTVEDAEHMMATRLWQNTAKVHFDTTVRDDGSRLVYGGHVISIARALSFNGLANAQFIAAINSGAHANPCVAGTTIGAWSEVLERSETAVPDVGALRLRTVATSRKDVGFELRGDNGRYLPHVLLDLDYWVFMPV